MKAILINDFGSVENVSLADVDDISSPGKGEVVVRVRAAGLNRADILQRLGRYPAPSGYPQNIPGLEFSGIVESLGEEVQSISIGDRVMGMIPGGAQAELVSLDASLLIPIPDHLSFEEAAAIPEAFITAFDALILQAGLAKSESVLIHAVGSGVGLAAVQIAHSIGAEVFGTSRSREKLLRAAEFGLRHSFLIDDNNQFSDEIKSSNGGVDVILDLVGGSYLKENIDALKPKGRLMLVGLTGGTRAEMDLSMILSKRLLLKGTVLRSRSLSERIDLTRRFNQEVLPQFVSGRLIPNVDKVYPAEEIQTAHRWLESNENFGKIVITF